MEKLKCLKKDNKMTKIIGANPNSSGLGDVLLLTAICKHFPDVIVQLHPDYSRFAFLFNGLCKQVELTTTPIHTPAMKENFTVTEAMLAEFGYFGKDTTPFIFVDRDNYEQAKQELKYIKNPIVVKANCSSRWKHVRQYDINYVQKEVNKLILAGFAPIQFGISDNFTPLDGCIHMIDVDIQKLSAIYKVIGHYFGTDTGDMHLMIAVGGTCTVLVPEKNHLEYNPDQFVHRCDRITRQIVPKQYCNY